MRYDFIIWSSSYIYTVAGARMPQNSSGEHKISTCKRIAKEIVPDLYAMDPTVAGERIRAKIGWYVLVPLA